ncbi:FUSC family protein [Bradyrhizobium sp. dw_411]|uniref:FUSC family protein n=1 Tax=Bradyrhizobium sp. dw_411 TaxID=2720082 RepID=UPI001BCCB2BD|nr:FUSC family protein [Bradyrhizobium sp. dw_411]
MTAFLKRIWAWLKSRKVELGLGIRVTVAAMSALVIALAVGLKLPLWAVLTSLIVTQMSVGRSLKATRDYLVGTLGGAVYGAFIAVMIPHSGEGALLAVLVLAVAPLAFMAAINPSLNVATVTAIIVLLLPTMNHGNPLDSAIDRVLEVAVGALSGLLVSFLVLPSRAHSHVRTKAAQALELMASALDELLCGLTRGRDNDALHALQDGIGTAMVGLNATGAEAERERAARLSSGPDTGPLLRTVLRLRHDLVMVGRASVIPLPANLQQRLAGPLRRVSDSIAAYLRASAATLRTGNNPPAIEPLEAELEAYAAEVAGCRAEGLTRGLPADAIERFFTLRFSLEQMHQNLRDLQRCVAVWTEQSEVPAQERGDGAKGGEQGLKK